jgi:hypothetical protein
MNHTPLKFIFALILLTGLPLAGLVSAGRDLSVYLEFPPQTTYVEHAPFSMIVFAGLSLTMIVILLPFAARSWRTLKTPSGPVGKERFSFPWWGYAGLFTGIASWILAWTRFEWFASFQLHTFIPLWFSYILVVNALTVRRTGTCLMTAQPRPFWALFPVSSLFWWLFEYLNRFVQNWHYVQAGRFTPLEYFLLATASFSTVLPAFMSTREYLLSFSFFERAFGKVLPINPSRPKRLAWASLILSCMGLGAIGLFSDYLFPLLWVSPLVFVISLQTLNKERHILSDLTQGRWTLVVVSAFSAWVCGFFWEMWNYLSLNKWIYSVPFVQALHVFEMPLPGYAGYLPFGLECAIIGEIVFALVIPKAELLPKL